MKTLWNSAANLFYKQTTSCRNHWRGVPIRLLPLALHTVGRIVLVCAVRCAVHGLIEMNDACVNELAQPNTPAIFIHRNFCRETPMNHFWTNKNSIASNVTFLRYTESTNWMCESMDQFAFFVLGPLIGFWIGHTTHAQSHRLTIVRK